MKYKIVKYRNLKRKNIFDTYKPEYKIAFSPESTVPFLIRVGHKFSVLGGLLSFFVSCSLMIFREIFRLTDKIHRFSFNKRFVEIRLKKD